MRTEFVKMKIVFILVISLFVAACQTTEEARERNAQKDDEYCRSISARVGSDAYVNCRLSIDLQRQQNAEAARAALNRQFQQMMNPQRVNCRSVLVGNVRQTQCW